MEMCDLVDGSGARTGRTVARGTELPRGEYYPVVHVWIKNGAGEYLVQRRAEHLASGPGVWATTVGHVSAGETGVCAAIREVEEELGIRLTPASLRRFGRLRTGDRLEDLWLAEVDEHRVGEPTPGPEVADWGWASKEELRRMANRGDFFRYSYLDRVPG